MRRVPDAVRFRVCKAFHYAVQVANDDAAVRYPLSEINTACMSVASSMMRQAHIILMLQN
jgi:hypothetical protein